MALLLALLSSAMWGFADFIGGVTTKRMHVLMATGISQFFGMVTVGVYAVFVGIEWSGPLLVWSLVSSVAGFSGLLCFYQALSTGRMGIVSPIAALGALVPLAAGLLSGERPSGLQILGIVIAVVGIVLASGPEVSGGASPRPVLLAVGAAGGFGVALWAIARGSAYSVAGVMFTMRVMSVLIAVVAVLLMGNRVERTVSSWRGLVTMGVFDVGANVLFGYATVAGMLSLVSVIGSLYPVMTAVLAWAVLKERLQAVQYVGVVAAMLGVAAIAGG